jgi:dihydrolipoamide dehydrogenase
MRRQRVQGETNPDITGEIMSSTPNETRKVDVAIIGAGSAGLNAWRGATFAGATAMLIDPGPLGTTCARVGCMPSKLVIAASEIAHAIEHGPKFGVHARDVKIDPVATMERVRAMRDGFVTKTKESYRAMDADGLLLRERATFIDAHTVRAGDQQVVARSFVLATGSRPWAPPPYRELGDLLLTNESIFELPRLPESLLVVGAGPIGLELGQAFHRLGVRVTILDIEGRIAGLVDPDVAASARAIFAEELDIQLNHELDEVGRVDDGVEIAFAADDGSKRRERFQYVLAATGRRPNLEHLGLEEAGLLPLPELDPRTGRLGTSHLFMAGDVTGDRMLLHEAGHEGRIAGANAARFPEVEASTRKVPLALVFSAPQVAMVGARHSELSERDIVVPVDFVKQPRAKVLGTNKGRGNLYADPNGKLIGAELLGPDVEHLGHLLAWVTQLGLTAAEVLELPFYHPVIEEALLDSLRKIVAHSK